MIDHLVGRPNPSWKRLQVFFVIFFWLWKILHGNPGGPRILWIRRANRALQRFTPWQIVVSTLTGVYAVRNLDKILGFGSPEPLANLYSSNYYRATWISTGLDAGFATAMSIRPKWLKDICSVLFSIYYIIYATEADEKLRRFRAVPTVEMLRTTWEKTTNPYIRALSYYPRISIRRKLTLPRPKDSTYQRPITAWLYFSPPEHRLARATEMVLDFPGGGFISMTPEHHEERLRMWAVRTGRPILSIEYGKAPEYPYPFAIDECFDVYRVLVESAGKLIGMSGTSLEIILTGDSAGAHVAVAVMIKILETQLPVPHPLALQLNYAALDFNFGSWMSPENLRVLQSEQSSGHLPGLAEQKDHFKHVSPLSMVGDRKPLRRRRSWRDALRTLTSPVSEKPAIRSRASAPSVRTVKAVRPALNGRKVSLDLVEEAGALADEEDGADLSTVPEQDRPIHARVRFNPVVSQVDSGPPAEASEAVANGGPSHVENKVPLGTRLTMTSRTGYFQDRIISPSMMRAMAILFIGPHRNPDFASDYHLSPVLAPSHILAQFPPLIMTCGEKDPFVDDNVIFAGRVREAKRARRKELEQLVSGKSAKFGDQLRMTSREVGLDEATLRAAKRELAELASQTEEDWVQLHIFSDWSHGYMQMASLMPEARTVINDLADRMEDVFASKRGRRRRYEETGVEGRRNRIASTSTGAVDAGQPTASAASETEVETETDDPLMFTTKKRSPPPSVGAKDRINGRRSGSSSRHPQVNTGAVDRQSDSHVRLSTDDSMDNGVHRVGTMPEHTSNGPDGVAPSFAASRVVATGASGAGQASAHPGIPSRPSSASKVGGKAGQTISESELMRRRRLLDSHLIASDT